MRRVFFFVLLQCEAFVLQQQQQQCASRWRKRVLRAQEDDGADVVIIGAGYGGLSAAALLATYNKRVTVVESHDRVGGVAHAFEREGYTLDVGPSLWSGLSTPSTNPMRQVLDATGAARDLEWRTYDGWGVHEVKTGRKFRMTTSGSVFGEVAAEFGDVDEWSAFLESVEPVFEASASCPPMALTLNPLGFLKEAFLPYLLPAIAKSSFRKGTFVPDLLTGPASKLHVFRKRGFVSRWIDYLAFAISGLPANGTVGAAVAYSVGDLYLRRGSYADYPVGGSAAVAEALKKTIEEKGGSVLLKAHVAAINISDNIARGVTLRDGTFVAANDAVVSNADLWTTAALTGDDAWIKDLHKNLVATPSFLHLWVGFDAKGLPEDLDGHHTVLVDGTFADDDVPIDARANMMIVCISSFFDASVAPEGKHLAHVYAAATEPREDWDNFDSRQSYDDAKTRAMEPLWRALEAIVPDVRRRSDLVVAGTPRSHEFWNRRHRGTYGPTTFAQGTTPVATNLYTVGDSNFPGIGIPAVAASACLVANAIAGRKAHADLLSAMRTNNTLRAGSDWWHLALQHRPSPLPGGTLSSSSNDEYSSENKMASS